MFDILKKYNVAKGDPLGADYDEMADPLSADIYEKVHERKAFNASAIVPNDHWAVLGSAMQKYLADRSDREELTEAILVLNIIYTKKLPLAAFLY